MESLELRDDIQVRGAVWSSKPHRCILDLEGAAHTQEVWAKVQVVLLEDLHCATLAVFSSDEKGEIQVCKPMMVAPGLHNPIVAWRTAYLLSQFQFVTMDDIQVACNMAWRLPQETWTTAVETLGLPQCQRLMSEPVPSEIIHISKLLHETGFPLDLETFTIEVDCHTLEWTSDLDGMGVLHPSWIAQRREAEHDLLIFYQPWIDACRHLVPEETWGRVEHRIIQGHQRGFHNKGIAQMISAAIAITMGEAAIEGSKDPIDLSCRSFKAILGSMARVSIFFTSLDRHDLLSPVSLEEFQSATAEMTAMWAFAPISVQLPGANYEDDDLPQLFGGGD